MAKCQIYNTSTGVEITSFNPSSAKTDFIQSIGVPMGALIESAAEKMCGYTTPVIWTQQRDTEYQSRAR